MRGGAPIDLERAADLWTTTAVGVYQGLTIVADPGPLRRIRLWAASFGTHIAAAVPGNLGILLVNGNASSVVWVAGWTGVGSVHATFPGGTIVDYPNNRALAYRVASSINAVQTRVVVYYTTEDA